jgi:hypothetical protein
MRPARRWNQLGGITQKAGRMYLQVNTGIFLAIIEWRHLDDPAHSGDDSSKHLLIPL